MRWPLEVVISHSALFICYKILNSSHVWGPKFIFFIFVRNIYLLSWKYWFFSRSLSLNALHTMHIVENYNFRVFAMRSQFSAQNVYNVATSTLFVWACSMLLSDFARFWLASVMITGANGRFGRAQYLHKCLFAVDSNVNGKTTQRVHKNSYIRRRWKSIITTWDMYVVSMARSEPRQFLLYDTILIHKRTIHTGTAVIWIRLVIFLLLLLFFSPSGDFEFLYKLNKYIILPSSSCSWWSLYAMYCCIVEQNCACELCIDLSEMKAIVASL